MPKRRAILLIAVFLALYPVSYLIVSRNGFYDPGAQGLAQGPNNTAIFVSKFGPDWCPFLGYPNSGSWDYDDFRHAPVDTIFGLLYWPMVELDRKCWHTQKEGRALERAALGLSP